MSEMPLKNRTIYKFYVTFYGNALKICCTWLTPPTISDPTPLVTLQYIYFQPKNEYARRVAYTQG